MANPLDLKCFNALNNGTGSTTKLFKCNECNVSFSDKTYFEAHRQSHSSQKEITSVQIVMNPPIQSQTSHTVPAAHQQQVQISNQHPQIHIIQDPQLAAYKRAYGADSQPIPIYNVGPVATQYQVVSSNERNAFTATSLTVPSYNYVFATGTSPSEISLQEIPQIQEVVQPIQLTPQVHQLNDSIQIVQPQTVQPQRRTSRVMPNNTEQKNRPYKCDMCTASFIEPNELEEHKKKHSDGGPFTCEDCQFSFMYKNHFRSHKTRCQKKRASNLLKQIVPAEPVKKEFPVNETNNVKTKITKSNSMLSKHAGQADFNPENPTFKRQRRTHCNDRPFECDECDANFMTEAEFQNHRLKHTGEGPFKCEECKYYFLYRKLYEAHRRRCEKKRKASDIILPPPPPPPPTTASVIEMIPEHDYQPGQIIPTETMLQHHQSVSQHLQIHGTRTVTAVPVSMHNSTIAVPIQMHPISSQGAAVIDMRVPTHDSHSIQGQHLQLAHHGLMEHQVIHIIPSSQVSGDREELKYDIIPAVEIDGVNQIVNLIKVKDDPNGVNS